MTVTAVEASEATYRTVLADAAMRGRTGIVVADAASAAEALRLALGGSDLVIHAVAARLVLDRLYEDLRRVGPVEVTSKPAPPMPGAELDDDGRALLELLARGVTLNEAAATLHLSLRTANRRLAAARSTLGVATTIEAIAVLSSRRSPPA